MEVAARPLDSSLRGISSLSLLLSLSCLDLLLRCAGSALGRGVCASFSLGVGRSRLTRGDADEGVTAWEEKMVGLKRASITASVSERGGGRPRLVWPRIEDAEDVVEDVRLSPACSESPRDPLKVVLRGVRG